MLHLFRFIRKDLIQVNNVKKYLLYALGEIVLIVVGILIALQIGNWNQVRRDRVEEQYVLLRLREEVEQFVIRYPRFLENLENKKLALGRVAQVFEGHAIENNLSFLKDVRDAAIWGSGIPLDGRTAFNEFVSTGKLGLIEENNLRAQIMEYYDFILTFERLSDHRSSDFSAISYDLVPREGSAGIKEGLGEKKYAAVVSSVLDSDLHREIIEEWWDRLADQATALLAEIEAELEKK
jgi:hypothetical protein